MMPIALTCDIDATIELLRWQSVSVNSTIT